MDESDKLWVRLQKAVLYYEGAYALGLPKEKCLSELEKCRGSFDSLSKQEKLVLSERMIWLISIRGKET
jgi:hypothetical protein